MNKKKGIIHTFWIIFVYVLIVGGTLSIFSEEKFVDQVLIARWTGKVSDSNFSAKVLKKNNKKIFEVTYEEMDDTFISGKEEALERSRYRAYFHLLMVEHICKDVLKGYDFFKFVYHEKIVRPDGQIISNSSETLLSDCKEFVDNTITENEFTDRIKILNK